MTIDFYGKKFDEYEQTYNVPYIGYISSDGLLIDYNDDLGVSHSTLDNIIPWTFLLWIEESNIIEKINNNLEITLDMDSGIINGITFPYNKNILLLQKDLLMFLKKAKNDPNFINKIKEKTKRKNNQPNLNSIYEVEKILGFNNIKALLVLLKDICIQYLGYDAIEQVKPNGELLKVDSYKTYFDKPRIITTSNININERFYNYLIMNWKIQKVPRYIFDDETKRFIIDDTSTNLFQSEKDLTYEQEVESIKRLVPLKERPKYFR